MKQLLFLLLPLPLFAVGIPFVPVQDIEAEQVIFEEKVVHLKGNVKVVHEIGVICCDEGTLHLRKGDGQEDGLSINAIELHKHVRINFTDGSTLSADEGEIDCLTFNTIFRATPPEKVIYITYTDQGKSRIPVKATSKALRATLKQSETGYALSSLKGEGAVHIEYLNKEPQS